MLVILSDYWQAKNFLSTLCFHSIPPTVGFLRWVWLQGERKVKYWRLAPNDREDFKKSLWYFLRFILELHLDYRKVLLQVFPPQVPEAEMESAKEACLEYLMQPHVFVPTYHKTMWHLKTYTQNYLLDDHHNPLFCHRFAYNQLSPGTNFLFCLDVPNTHRVGQVGERWHREDCQKEWSHFNGLLSSLSQVLPWLDDYEALPLCLVSKEIRIAVWRYQFMQM